MNDLRPTTTLRQRATKALAAAGGDIVGVVSYALIVAGSYLEWGLARALLVAGGPLFAFYLWGQVRAVRAGHRMEG